MQSQNDYNSDEEYIPPAPAFCQRLTQEEAVLQAQKYTKTGLEQLYHNVINKIDKDRENKEKEKEIANYTKILQQSKLVDAVQQFFECDEERQKAKFMNMLIDNNRNGDKVINLEAQVKTLEGIVNELKDSEEHTSEVMQGYEEAEGEFKENIKNLKLKLEIEKQANETKTATIRKLEKELENQMRYSRFIMFTMFSMFAVMLAMNFYM